MSNLARAVVGFVLLGMVSVPALSSAQLLDRNRLKPPLLRLPNLGQRQAKKKNQNQQPNHNQHAPVVIQEHVVVPPIAQPASTAPAASPSPVPGVNPLPQQSVAPLAGTAAPGAPGAIAPQPPVAGAPIAVAARPFPPAALPAATQPIPSATATPLATAQALPLAEPASQPVAEAVPPSSAQPAIEKIAASNTQLAPPAAAPPISAPQRTMNLALDDAQAALDHMRANVRDYTCDFVKRERVKGTLVPTETAFMKIRNRVVQNGQVVVPLSVYMKFTGPASMKGREALFVEGQNNEKIHVKEGGTKGRFLPALWLSQNSAFTMATNRYHISQIGMTRLAERLIENGRVTPMDGCNVKYIHGAKVDNRTCSYLEIVRPTPRPGIPVGHNNVYYAQIFIDSELKMPIRFVACDWPTQPGGKPRLIEEYTYRNIKVNTGLTDMDFSSKNPNYRF